jgi:hypothetical protein
MFNDITDKIKHAINSLIFPKESPTIPDIIYKKKVDWIFWQVSWPLILMTLTWLLLKLVPHVKCTFAIIFGTGDCIVYSVSLVLCVIVELREATHRNSELTNDKFVYLCQQLLLLFIIILVFIYPIVKIIHLKSPEAISGTGGLFSPCVVLSISFVLLTVAFSSFVLFIILEKEFQILHNKINQINK